jgi:hypothetical protein
MERKELIRRVFYLLGRDGLTVTTDGSDNIWVFEDGTKRCFQIFATEWSKPPSWYEASIAAIERGEVE